jgi:hypothetical protein
MENAHRKAPEWTKFISSEILHKILSKRRLTYFLAIPMKTWDYREKRSYHRNIPMI